MLHQATQCEDANGIADAPLDLAVIIPIFQETTDVAARLQKLSLALAGISWRK